MSGWVFQHSWSLMLIQMSLDICWQMTFNAGKSMHEDFWARRNWCLRINLLILSNLDQDIRETLWSSQASFLSSQTTVSNRVQSEMKSQVLKIDIFLYTGIQEWCCAFAVQVTVGKPSFHWNVRSEDLGLEQHTWLHVAVHMWASWSCLTCDWPWHVVVPFLGTGNTLPPSYLASLLHLFSIA